MSRGASRSHRKSDRTPSATRGRRTRVLPQGSRPADSAAEWVLTVSLATALAPLRADAHRNLMRVVWVLAASASADSDVVAWPGWEYLQTRTGLSRRSVARILARLRDEYSLLAISSPGTTPLQRGGILDDGFGDQRAEYLLCVPTRSEQPDPEEAPEPQADHGGEETGTPTRVPVGNEGRGSAPNARARKTQPTQAPTRRRKPELGAGEQAQRWPMTAVPATRSEMLAAAQRLQLESVTLRRISARYLRALLRPVFRSGATPRDVLHALDHTPDGQAWRHTHTVRHLPGWMRHRLAAWHTPEGGFHPWPSQQASRERQKLRQRQHHDRRRAEEARAAAADPDRVHTLVTECKTRLLQQRTRRRHLTGAPATAGEQPQSAEATSDVEAHRQAQIAALSAWMGKAESG